MLIDQPADELRKARSISTVAMLRSLARGPRSGTAHHRIAATTTEKCGTGRWKHKKEGTLLIVRCQRAALQLWKVDTPWAKAGRVTVANDGDLLKERGWIPSYALAVDYAPVP